MLGFPETMQKCGLGRGPGASHRIREVCESLRFSMKLRGTGAAAGTPDCSYPLESYRALAGVGIFVFLISSRKTDVNGDK